MSDHPHRRRRAGRLNRASGFFGVLCLGGLALTGTPSSAAAQTITHLQELTPALKSGSPVIRDVRLEATVCAASRSKVGVLILRDETGVELLEMGDFGRAIRPGEKIRIEGQSVFLRRRGVGVEFSRPPVVNNDGTHVARVQEGSAVLKAGRVPLRVDWFNCLRDFDLEVGCADSNGSPSSIAAAQLGHAAVDASGHTNFLPGLRAEGYEGYWETVPDFQLLRPVKTGVVTHFDVGFRTRDEMVGLRFTGYFDVPHDGQYIFRLGSDDGSLLFLGPPELPVISTGFTNGPAPRPGLYGEAMASLTERRWIEMDGRVSSVVEKGEGLEFDLRSDRDVISVQVADAAGLEPAQLLNAHVKVRGVGQGVLTLDQRIVLGKVWVAGADGVVMVETASGGRPSVPITTVGGVQGLPIEAARRLLPVRIRGMVTDAKNPAYDRWMSIQDETRGIFVMLTNVFDKPAFGEFWEVEGHSAAGDFAPVIIADHLTFLGAGRVPEPVRPTWNELINGSRDVQWAELHGLVTAVQSNTVALLLPEGQLEVHLDGLYESDLKRFEQCEVHIRGVLYARWNAKTREVHVGNVMMRNAAVSVDVPAPADRFAAVLKTPRELLLFDAQATAFRPVKVRGQIVHVDATQMFLEADGAGLRLLPAETVEVRPGDWVEAVGYPDIGRTTLLLREVRLRQTGTAALPAPIQLSEGELTREGLDSTRVRVEGKLLGWHSEQGAPVLEMQSGAHLYFARLTQPGPLFLRAGSRLALDGIYAGPGNPRPETQAESFELLLNSPADIVVLSQPSWWTLQRLMIVVGMLATVLAFALVWITQLRRLVDKRTAQLQREIHERERVEHQRALEAERSRIAQDLHDDLGSSLTEISVLASTGQRPESSETAQLTLFQTIGGKARNLIAALDVIVWAIDPEANTLQSLADYLSSYTDDFFAHTRISCRLKVPVAFPPVTIEGRVRHDLFMVVKEALNNIVRHAEATEVEFRMRMADGTLEIEIADNGKGFAGSPDGHGLKNFSARLLKLGGSSAVESRVGGGTTVKIRLPLAAFTETKAARANTTFD